MSGKHGVDLSLTLRALDEASRTLARLRLVRGASRRTHRRMARAAAVMVAAAGLMSAAPARANNPEFYSLGIGLDEVLSSHVADNSSPSFADIDGDGDLDAFIGESNGDTIFFENTGTSAAPAFAASSANPFGLVDVGLYSSPSFADIDGDGDLDAFIGEASGSTFFFENTGTSAAPAFAASSANPFGLFDLSYRSSPSFADIDGDGDLDAFIGNEDGDTFFFENLGFADFEYRPTLSPGCFFYFNRGQLLVKEKNPGKEKIIAKWLDGPILHDIFQSDLGNPLTVNGTTYRLCIYDDDSGDLVASLAIEGAGQTCDGKPCWSSIGQEPPSGKGYKYKDKNAAIDGVKVVKLKGGEHFRGNSKLLVKAANNAGKGQTSMPTGISALLAGKNNVTIELQSCEGACFSASVSAIKSDADFFKGK